MPKDVVGSLRVALLLDPFSVVLEDPLGLRGKWWDHAPMLARELLGRGHSVRGFGAPPGLIPRSSEDAGAEGGVEGPSSRWVRLRTFRPDVLVAYDALSPAAVRGARMARKLGAALVLVEEGLPDGGRWYQRALARTGELLWGRYVRNTADVLLALDSIARDRALREGFADAVVSIVPRGVDLTQFRPGLTSTLVARNRIRGRSLLYVGRLEAHRGLEVLVSAFARTVGQRSDWNLVLAGDGSWGPRLRAMAHRLGVGSLVHWLPRPQREELPGLMGASTMLVVPARDERVVGRQIGRALACGLPVLASDLPRFRGLMEHEGTGLLVEPGSVDAWAEAIGRAATSPTLRRRWGEAGRRFAEERLGWSPVSERIEALLFEARERSVLRARRTTDAEPRESGA